MIDVKVTYSKSLKNPSSIIEVVQFDNDIHDYDQLLKLTYYSGHDSRFLKDPSLGLFQFKRLYKKWIDSSIVDHDTLVLISPDASNINGFVTVKKNQIEAQIGLIAVSPDCQGKGIGKKLINSIESVLEPCSKLLVATQETNKTACRFYESLGFSLEKKEYIYHYKP